MVIKKLLAGNHITDLIKCRSLEKRYFLFNIENQEYLNEEPQTIKEIAFELCIEIENVKKFTKNAGLVLQMSKSFTL